MSVVNANVTGATGDITITADSDNSGSGAITEVLSGEAANLIGDVVTLNAATGIGSSGGTADIDTTIKPLYGKQEGAVVSYNPHKPGRPSHSYHTYLMAGLRLVMGVEVKAGNEHSGNHTLPGLLKILDELPAEHRPKMVVAGFSAYSQVVDWARFRAIADKVGAYLFVDMAHVAGLVAAGVYPNPVPHADVVTSTTHKTLRGPRGGIIIAKANEEIEKKLQSIVFPGIQGGPLMHVIAAKAVAFKEALEPEFKAYQQQVVKNAQAMANTVIARGYKIVSGGTQNHLMLVDMIGKGITGKDAEAALGRAHITVNKNAVPNDPQKPFVTSGLRLGTPAVTTRGYGEQDCIDLANWICDVLDAPKDEAVIARVKANVEAQCRKYPVYG